MDNSLGMAMIDCLEQLLHVSCSFELSESLILLLGNLVKQLTATYVFHHQIHVLAVIVGLEIFHNVWMVKAIEYSYFLHNTIDIISQFVLIEHFYGDLEIFLKLISCLENSTECTDAKNFSFVINDVILFKFVNTLLFTTFMS